MRNTPHTSFLPSGMRVAWQPHHLTWLGPAQFIRSLSTCKSWAQMGDDDKLWARWLARGLLFDQRVASRLNYVAYLRLVERTRRILAPTVGGGKSWRCITADFAVDDKRWLSSPRWLWGSRLGHAHPFLCINSALVHSRSACQSACLCIDIYVCLCISVHTHICTLIYACLSMHICMSAEDVSAMSLQWSVVGMSVLGCLCGSSHLIVH